MAGEHGEFLLLVPVEGAVQDVSAVAIPASAPHPCAAHTFIDFLLEPAVLADQRNFPPSEVADRLFGLVDTGDLEPSFTDAYLRARG